MIDEKSCPEPQTVTDHDGNVYATVKIGEQGWTRENLRTTTSPSTGTYLIPALSTGPTYTGKQVRWYNNDSATYAPPKYGLLYNWNAAVDTFNTAFDETSVNNTERNAVSVTFTGNRRGICPEGWHVQSVAEWDALKNYVSSQSEYTCDGNSNNIYKTFASTTGWTSDNNSCAIGNNPSVNNATNFSLIPAGFWNTMPFLDAGKNANFWTSTQAADNDNRARKYSISYYTACLDNNTFKKINGYSVCCIRN